MSALSIPISQRILKYTFQKNIERSTTILYKIIYRASEYFLDHFKFSVLKQSISELLRFL